MIWTRRDQLDTKYLNGFCHPRDGEVFSRAHPVRRYVRPAHPDTLAEFPGYPRLMESYSVVDGDGVRRVFHNLFQDLPDPACIGVGMVHYRWAAIDPPETETPK